MEIATTRCCLDKQVSWLSWNLRALGWENTQRFPYNSIAWKLKTNNKRFAYLNIDSGRKRRKSPIVCKTHTMPVGLEDCSSLQSEDTFSEDEHVSEDSPDQLLAKPLSNDELKYLLADSEREKLTKKLSEANQQNHFLKRQLHDKEDALLNFKSELAVMELEIQALVSLAEEISKAGIPEGSRKINGRYIQSHLHTHLEGTNQGCRCCSVEGSSIVVVWHGRKCTSYGFIRWMESRGTLIPRIHRFIHQVLRHVISETRKV